MRNQYEKVPENMLYFVTPGSLFKKAPIAGVLSPGSSSGTGGCVLADSWRVYK